MRKVILAAVVCLITAFSVTSCSNGQLNNQAVAVVAQDVSIIANGLNGALPALQADKVITPDQMALISKAIMDLQSVSNSVQAATTTSAALPMVQQVEADVNAIVGALSLVPGLPENISLTLVAAQVLLPVIETAVGMVLPPTSPVTAKVTRYSLTPAEARAILIGQAHR